MKLLFCQRNLLMQRDMEEALTHMNIFFRCASYIFTNTDSDDYYCSHLRSFLLEDNYDAVFSFNFIPLIADVCHEMSIPYIVWTYDAGWEFRRLDALFYPTNYLFHFDRRACRDYKEAGYSHISHMPLAVNCRRLDAMSSSPEQLASYSSQVAFVGSLYEKYTNTLPAIFQSMPPDSRTSFLQYVCRESQSYNQHQLWDVITTETAQKLYPQFPASPAVVRLQLLAACAAMIAGRQRESILNDIANKFPLELYTTSPDGIIKNANYRWRAAYYSQMPLIFRHAVCNLNLTIPSIQTGLPLRILDILGAGGFLLTNEQEELHDYFTVGKDLDTFHSPEELTEKLHFYLAHPEITKEIAANGHAIVKNDFSYETQFQKILSIVGLHH